MKVGSKVKGVPKHLLEWTQTDNLHVDEIGTKEEKEKKYKIYIWCGLGVKQECKTTIYIKIKLF